LNRGHRIIALMKELQSMPEYELVTSLTGFNISIFTFDKNFIELKSMIEFLTTDPRADHLFWLRNRDQLSQVLYNIIRLLHNYVASALSLIDHTMRLHHKLSSQPPRFPEYGARVASEFTSDPLTQFVRGLREYCQHYRSPNLSVKVSWKPGDERETRTIWLLKDDLVSFDGWSAPAKAFLATVADNVNVLETATTFREKVIDFNRWFQERQQQIHAPEIENYRVKENELLTLTLEDKIELALANKDRDIPRERDEIFLSIFSSSEFAELETFALDSPERAERATELLQRYYPVPEHIKQGIMRWYLEVGSKLKGGMDNSAA